MKITIPIRGNSLLTEGLRRYHLQQDHPRHGQRMEYTLNPVVENIHIKEKKYTYDTSIVLN